METPSSCPPPCPPKHVILFLAANPRDTTHITLDREAHAIYSELRRSGGRDLCEFVPRWAAGPVDLRRELRELQPTVVHFSGHGVGAAAAARDGLARRDVALPGAAEGADGMGFESADGESQLVTPKALAHTLAASGAPVRLVVLNACYSASSAQALLAQVE